MNHKPPPLILIAGPTATGKTALAVALARRVHAEIISADSMQVYKGCAIGTAQPAPEELGDAVCHLCGRVEPDRPWSVADWLRDARRHADDIRQRGKAVIVAGGTGLYFKALTNGLFQTGGAAGDPAVRSRLEAEWAADAGVALRQRLERVDPTAAARVHPNDAIRTVRALEVFELTGRPLSDLQAEDRSGHRPPAAWRFVLCAGREALYKRIDQRVDEMMDKGFLEEVRALMKKGADLRWPCMRALGYPQLLRHLRGELGLAEAVEETKRLSRRYAKQQMVLYRQWPGAVWLDVERPAKENLLFVEKVLEKAPPLGF